MKFFKESLYGWGVCQVPMPRARNDIYADRRQAQQPVGFADRRTGGVLQPAAVLFAAIFREDFPVRHALMVGLGAILLLLLLGLPIPSVPPLAELPVPPPVEIATRLLEEPALEPPAPQPPVVAEPAPKPQPVAIEKPVAPKVVAEPVQPQRTKVVSLAPAKEPPQLRTVPKKIAMPVERPVPMPKKVVTMATPVQQVPVAKPLVPKRRERSYTVTVTQPQLVSERPVLGGQTAPTLVAPRKTTSAANYSLKADSAGQPARRQGAAFTATAPGTTVDLPSTSGAKADFSMPRSQGGHAVTRAGTSFAPEPGGAAVDIASAGPAARSYATASGQASAGPPVSGVPVGAFAAGTAADVELPSASGRGVSGLAAAVSGSTAGSGPPGSAVHFVGDGEAGADPNLAIDLSQLAACIDQSEEDRLRTELAIRLDENVVFPCGQMKFDIKYVETGQTVQMRIYNPRAFADRCEALLSAIECIDHSK